ncbi:MULTISPECIES: flagellar biosynthesis regulator FlaF [Methylobacterium]|jgi:flagellar protein FlaF|uniref:Flagellar protein FlaF n=3 Tax=Methylobacterium TaxID=407 RepID=A0AAE8L754_9HYPH|nr:MULTISPECIES: flagellar biosynthesis regulator FlaF [Methylobacterium]KOX42926.1 flagellar protein FlaF [Streptomyces purpurogeneiscleroticus]AIQ93727.1 Flagellar FlaF family protein [Methylobacterium oryzae CBMB20]APT33990.1 flagellar protein FlaF [Methylobacterium phyllosphaerae]AWV14706.1 flagellar protein FlaF [Methylobacterium sp. XJLW]MBA9060888.1 flagellar protein FlaF [Methylobacterium fujisawaense]
MNYAANAYAKTSHSALSPREAESAVLLKAAQKLIGASQGLSEGDAGRLNDALSFNQRVWTLLTSEATSDLNPLPSDVKQGVGRLGVFVLQSCIDTMIAPTPEKIATLVSINNHIAAGLQGNPG